MATSAQLAERLDRTLKAAGLAIVGVSIGNPANAATWRVNPPELQADAQAIIDSFNPDDAAVVSAAKDTIAANIDDNLLIQAVAQLDFEERQKLEVKAGQTLRTAAECKARVKAIYKNLLP